MIEETAVVVDVDGDTVWVETQRKTTCGSCSANKGCGAAVLGKVMGNRRTRVRALNDLNLVPGDEVVVGVQENAVVYGSFAVYTVPLLAMFGFALAGELFASRLHLGFSEGAGILFALAGLTVGFLWLARFTRRIRRDPRFQAVVVRKVIPVHAVEFQT